MSRSDNLQQLGERSGLPREDPRVVKRMALVLVVLGANPAKLLDGQADRCVIVLGSSSERLRCYWLGLRGKAGGGSLVLVYCIRRND